MTTTDQTGPFPLCSSSWPIGFCTCPAADPTGGYFVWWKCLTSLNCQSSPFNIVLIQFVDNYNFITIVVWDSFILVDQVIVGTMGNVPPIWVWCGGHFWCYSLLLDSAYWRVGPRPGFCTSTEVRHSFIVSLSVLVSSLFSHGPSLKDKSVFYESKKRKLSLHPINELFIMNKKSEN